MVFDRIKKVFSRKPDHAAAEPPRAAEPIGEAPAPAEEPATAEEPPPAEQPAWDSGPAPRFDIENEDDHVLRPGIVVALRQVYDPEIPIDIFEMGLIYGVDIGDDGAIQIRMTLTSPNCPVAGTLPLDVEKRVKTVEGVTDCSVEIVWEPTWHPDMITEAGKLELGMM